jgi:protein TonB
MKAFLTLAGVMLVLLACGSQPKTTPVAGNAVPPKAESLVQPPYPEEARKAGATGTAIVEVTVGADGVMRRCSLVVSSGNSQLDEAALQAVRVSKFAAGTRDGKPIQMKVKVPFRFKLDDKQKEQRGEAQVAPRLAGRHEPGMPAMEV